MWLFLLFACADKGDSDTAAPLATLRFVDPIDGDTVTGPSVGFSIVVESFALVEPAKHNEGEAEGYLEVFVDSASVLETGLTQFDLTLTPGAPPVGAALRFSDRDPLDPPVEASVNITVE